MMTHLGERITDFVFGELSPAEMDEARGHIESCSDCRTRVEQFEQTRSLLKMSPDEEPPHRIVFEIEKRPRGNFWQWLVPAGLAAAILAAVLVAAPPHLQWNDSQLTIAFGTPSPVAVAPPPAPAVQTAVVEPDYERILKALEKEFDKRDAVQLKKIQRSLDEWTYLDAQKRDFERKASQLIVESGVQE